MENLKRRAFTLIELLVVIAIIGILSALIVIGMNNTTQKANIAKAQVFANSLRNSLMSDLVSEWKLDNNLTDTWAASHANNGTWSGATAPNTVATYGTTSECVSGQCMDFDSVDDMVSFGTDLSLSMESRDHTNSLWVKFDDAVASTVEMLTCCGITSTGTGQDGYRIYRAMSTSQLQASFSDGTATRLMGNLSADGSIVANSWYNIVVVFDRDSTAQAYINAAKQTGYSLTISSQAGDVQNLLSYRIGSVDSSTYHLAGKMDEVRIFHAITTMSQIEQNYFAGLNKLFAKSQITSSDYTQRISELLNSYAKK